MKKTNEKRKQNYSKNLIVRELLTIRGGGLEPGGATLPPIKGKSGN